MASASATDQDNVIEQILENDDDDESKNFLSSNSIATTPSTKNMAIEETNRGKTKNRRTEQNREFLQHMTTAAHACVLLFVILIIYFCFSEEFKFFTWHPLLLSTGWMFLMTEAILSVSKDNLFTGTLPKAIRVRLHWIFQAIALTFITVGFAIVFINKNYLNKTHFKTWHALFGLIGVVSTIPSTISGVAALFNVNLRHYIKPKINKFIHIVSGIATFGFGGLSLILSVYTHWFARLSNGNIITFALGLGFVVTAVVWTLTKKHSLLSKWNILFDKSPEWISFKPQLGLKVYPCYSCKNMFSSKLTFQDHINRRVVIIKYKCHDCTNTFTFYNRCSFLLHARKHFTMSEGRISLANVDILLLPVELAGFARHESIPFLYDEEEEYSENYINCQFYRPDDSDAGKPVITLRPFNLVFHYAEGSDNILLVLKQIGVNIPVCEFITQEYDKQAKSVDTNGANEPVEPEIKRELEMEEFTLPVISKIESLNNDGNLKKYPYCPECMAVQDMPMAAHFLGNNRPLDENLCCYVCKYVAPTKCSLKAHTRTHESASPFVCPECGKAFKTGPSLHSHMEEVCFHLSKQVRFRCPAQKCGKLFVLPNTYASHFSNHLQCVTKCSACSASFFNESDFAEHSKTHESCAAVKTFNCMVCKNIATLAEDQCADHINWHLQDRERCVYIFTCRFCRSYFRSTATYSVHKQRCAKGEKVQPVVVTTNCHFCKQKVVFREKDNYKTCSTCKQINHCPANANKNAKSPQEDRKAVCMLCKEELTQEHSKLCKYNNPIVTIHALSNEKDSDETSSSEKFSTSNSDAESKPSTLDTSNDSMKNEETPKKKRKRSGNSSTSRSKKTASSSEENADLQADKPISFDGTYYCKLCDYKNTERAQFHDHIISHRDVSTAYQCMECGQCFVVKPSLIKHLTHYHKIADTDEYFTKNDCYDKFAIEELENSLKMVPGEHKGPVNENQCTKTKNQTGRRKIFAITPTPTWRGCWNNGIYMVDDNRAIFLFKDGSQAWTAKEYLVEQERCESVTIESKVYPGKYAKNVKEEL
ncbi:zinc finger protein 532-like [Asbolus verrucosus]|uniref:Zinc finger protein 532-like n=1 Tax=Asbolus verrucosus TaxID=1661398 RepID=A0A482V8X6_ASBVE|nr:zinc finger protein 532-like [Asbolus verrucosus]